MQNRMPLAEGAALTVLARKTDSVPFHGQRSKRQRLRCRPVQWHFPRGHLSPLLEKLHKLGMNMKAFRNLDESFQQGAKRFDLHPSPAVALRRLISPLIARPKPDGIPRMRRFSFLRLLVLAPHQLAPLIALFLGLFFTKEVLRNQLLQVQLADIRPLADRL